MRKLKRKKKKESKIEELKVLFEKKEEVITEDKEIKNSNLQWKGG
jgi:hypothetical protein